MNKEKVGALIDGIYAIALTILVLELPKPESAQQIMEVVPQLIDYFTDYTLSFLLLFTFWYNQRRVNEFAENHNRITLWLNAFTLLFTCLIPYFTVLVHDYGNNNYIDLAYISNCLLVDVLIHAILQSHRKVRYKLGSEIEAIEQVIRSRRAATLIFVIVAFFAFISPVPNRQILVLVPLLLIFEDETLLLTQKMLALAGKLTRLK
jgi:uncharacterized membrane protein